MHVYLKPGNSLMGYHKQHLKLHAYNTVFLVHRCMLSRPSKLCNTIIYVIVHAIQYAYKKLYTGSYFFIVANQLLHVQGCTEFQVFL